MSARTSMLHVRADEDTKARAAEALAGSGLTLSDTVRVVLLARVATVGGLPPELVAEGAAYDAWFRAKVHEALDDPRPSIPHAEVMTGTRARIHAKRRSRT